MYIYREKEKHGERERERGDGKKKGAKYNSIGRFTRGKFIFQSSWHASDVGAATKSHHGWRVVVGRFYLYCLHCRRCTVERDILYYYLNGGRPFMPKTSVKCKKKQHIHARYESVPNNNKYL